MARLAIADPPYLGRGAMLYGAESVQFPGKVGKGWEKSCRQSGDAHPDAARWDEPGAHKSLVETLVRDYDRWVIAMNSENLYDYLQWVPRETRITAWCRPDAFPAGRIVRSWEPTLVYAPNVGRGEVQVRDFIVAPKSTGRSSERFVGAKPPQWTRWVLDMLGYDAETDTVDDLFGGSGAVSAEVAQGVLA